MTRSSSAVRKVPDSSEPLASPDGLRSLDDPDLRSLQDRMRKRFGESKSRSEQSSDHFVKVTLSREDVDHLDDWITRQSPAGPWDDLVALARQGFKVSFGLHDENQWVCTLRDSSRESEGKPYCLSGWSDDPVAAAWVVVYKHKVKLDGDWDAVGELPVSRPKYR